MALILIKIHNRENNGAEPYGKYDSSSAMPNAGTGLDTAGTYRAPLASQVDQHVTQPTIMYASFVSQA